MRLLKFFLHLLVPLLLFNHSDAQDFTDRLNRWSKNNPVEKTYLHFDRDTYFSGQTIWFKAYFLSAFHPSANNSTLIVELLNNNSQLAAKKIVPVFGALSYGQFDLPDSLPTGSYQLRAYTPLMLNFDKEYLFSKRILVYGANKGKAEPTRKAGIKLHFYPEGGNFVSGSLNTLAFKATDPYGLPVTVNGKITDTANREVADFTTQHDGMGVFKITPQATTRYRAVLSTGEQFDLPAPTSEGLVLQLKNAAAGKTFAIHYKGAAWSPAYLVGQMQHQVVFKQALSPDNTGKIAGVLQTKELPSGVLQFTVFNKDGMPLAERLTFVDNKEYVLATRFKTDVADNGFRKKNSFRIEFTDSITGNFSVAVTDADYESGASRPQNILSSLLLTSDIPGYVHHPAYYFTEDSLAREHVELVLLTNGWRRFKWTDVQANTLPEALHKDPGFISLSGKVNIAGSGKSFADQDLLVWIATDSGRSLQMIRTDTAGRFTMDSMIFFNKARVLFSDVMGAKNKFLTVRLDADSLTRSYSIPPLHIPYRPSAFAESPLGNKMYAAYNAYTRGEGVMLDSVVVLGTKSRLEKLEERYMSPLFAGGINARTFDFTREFIPNLTLFDYLQGRVAGLTVERGGAFDDYRLYFRQTGTRRPMALYLDEMPVTADMIAALNPNDIALVKLFPTFVGAPGGGGNGVLAVYTKRGDEWNHHLESSATIVDYEGYSIMKEFYAPDYARPAENSYNDLRLTLDWKPEVFISGADPVLPVTFYNNDRTKRFKVVAEGITSDGRMLMIEKYIDPSK